MTAFSRVSVGGVWVQGDDSAASSRVGAGDVWLQVAAAAGAGNTLSPGTGHLVLTGYVPSIDRQDGHFLSPGTGHLSLTGYVPSITQGAGKRYRPEPGT